MNWRSGAPCGCSCSPHRATICTAPSFRILFSLFYWPIQFLGDSIVKGVIDAQVLLALYLDESTKAGLIREIQILALLRLQYFFGDELDPAVVQSLLELLLA
jgi:hypothetical protein